MIQDVDKYYTFSSFKITTRSLSLFASSAEASNDDPTTPISEVTQPEMRRAPKLEKKKSGPPIPPRASDAVPNVIEPAFTYPQGE